MASYIVTDRIRVNIVHSFTVPPRVKCEQYDGDYTKLIQAIVYNGDVLYSIPSAVRRIVVSGLKPDGNGFSYDCTWSGNTVSFSLMRQMTVVDGKVPCNITMFDSENNQVSSAVFVLDVEKAALPSDVVVSSNDFQTFVDYVQAANLYWQYSKSYAVGNTGVREGENVDNAKYYAHLARMYKGSPLTASTISKMEDTERVYVYVGNESGYNNGHWYFYDDTAWVDGGVYNSEGIQTDTELVAEGVAADAKAVGDILGHETLETKTQTHSGAINELFNDVILKAWGMEQDISILYDDYIPQGLAFDGTYYYIGMIESENNVFTHSKIVKYDKNGNLILSSQDLYPRAFNTLFYYEGKLYTFDIDNVYIYNADTFALSEQISIAHDENYCSCFVDNDIIYMCNKTSIKEATSGTTIVTFSPSINLKIQSVKKYYGMYFMCCNFPSSIFVFNANGVLITTVDIPNIYNGVTLNELEDITIIDDGLIALFNVESNANSIARFVKLNFYGSNVALYSNQTVHAYDSVGATNVYVDGSANNVFQNGSADYPFITLFDACNYIRDKLGGYGRILIKAGTYKARLFSFNGTIMRNGDGIVNLLCEQLENVTVDFYHINLTLPSDIINSKIKFRAGSFSYPEVDRIRLVSSTFDTDTTIAFNISIDALSHFQGNHSDSVVRCYAQSFNCYKTTNKVAGSKLFDIANGAYYPKRIGIYFTSSDGYFVLDFPIGGKSHESPIAASVILSNGVVYTVQLRCYNNEITYFDCVKRNVSNISAVVERYAVSGDASHFPTASVVECYY